VWWAGEGKPSIALVMKKKRPLFGEGETVAGPRSSFSRQDQEEGEKGGRAISQAMKGTSPKPEETHRYVVAGEKKTERSVMWGGGLRRLAITRSDGERYF